MRRLAFLAALVVLAACVESDPSTVEVAPPGSGGTTVAPAPGPGGRPDASPPADGTPGTTVIGGSGESPETTIAEDSRVDPPPPGGPGSAARYVLGTKGARQLVVQVLTDDGVEPRQSTLDRIVSVLRDVSGKPVTTAGGPSPAPREVWTGDDLRSAADAAASPAADGAAVIRLLFVGGRSDQGEGVLGVAVSGDVAAVFSERVDAAATGLVSPTTIERAVAVHELGHLLGLVDLVLATGRDDPEHPGHSSNRRSVMYWAVESTLVGDLLTGGPPQNFDERDLADLATIRRG